MAAASCAEPRMSLWRLELLRLTRTPRALALALVFLVIGLIEPVATRYENRLLGHVGRVRISLPPPTPADGLNSYVSEVTRTSLILVAFTAEAMTFDAHHGLATFLRTRDRPGSWSRPGSRQRRRRGARVRARLARRLV